MERAMAIRILNVTALNMAVVLDVLTMPYMRLPLNKRSKTTK